MIQPLRAVGSLFDERERGEERRERGEERSEKERECVVCVCVRKRKKAGERKRTSEREESVKRDLTQRSTRPTTVVNET